MALQIFDDDNYSLYEEAYAVLKNWLVCGGDLDYILHGISKCTICGRETSWNMRIQNVEFYFLYTL